MRVYLPATSTTLRRLLTDGGLTGPLTAHAVTPALREAYAAGDLDELEYVASLDAAGASLRLLAEDPDAARRRVVIAADVPDATGVPDSGLGRSVVRLSVPVALDRVSAVHVDEPAAEGAVVAALPVLVAAEAGDEDAAFVASEVEGHDLLWYATQEAADLLTELERRGAQ